MSRNRSAPALGGSATDGPVIELDGVAVDFPRYRPSTAGLKELFTGRFGRRFAGPKLFRALDGISLAVERGEVLGVVGPNGSGKSTLLRVIAGIYEPDEGTVRLRGRVSLLSGLGAGFEDQLTGWENIFLHGSVLGLGRGEVRRRAAAIVEFSGLGDSIEQPMRTYSSGMRARLGFSIAAVLEPEVLLLDEVLEVGDLEFSHKSRRKIEEFAAGESTVVIVSHNLDTLKRMCGRAGCIVGGRLVALGDPETAIEAYRDHQKGRA